MNNPVCMLWLEHVDPAVLSIVPSVQRMAAEGIDMHLTPRPVVEERACYYQALTGMGAGKIGYFDAVKPVAYRAHLEEGVPDGILGRSLPDVLRTRGLAATMIEAKDHKELEAAVRMAGDCTIVRVVAENGPGVVEDLVRRCLEGLVPGAHLLVLAGVWRGPAASYVNINNFLADIGLLEVGAPRRQENITWPETLAYSLGNGQIWVNLRGREPQGCVASGREYQQVCEALQQKIASWRDPHTGAAVVARVLKKEDAYTGEYLFKAPDLVVEFHPGYAPSPQAAKLDFDAAAVYPSGSGEARMTGAPHARLIASGPNLLRGCREDAELVDVVPNITYLLGMPAPAHVDGRIIPALFTASHRQKHPQVRTEDDEFTLTSEEEGHIEERLRALGYLG